MPPNDLKKAEVLTSRFKHTFYQDETKKKKSGKRRIVDHKKLVIESGSER